VNQYSPAAPDFSARERALVNETLRFVASRAWRVTDTDFFYDLVRYLGENLGVTYAFCDTINPTDNTIVETLALYAHGEITGNISYSLKDTPCENVIGRSVCCYTDKVQQLFPQDHLLVEMGAESYAGTPLWAADGSPLGLVAVIDDKPIQRPELVTTILQIVAVRAGAVLERAQVLERLQDSEQRFRDFAEVSADWFWEQDENLRFTFISVTNAEVSGLLPEDHYGKTRRETGLIGVTEEDMLSHERLLDERKPFENFRFRRINAMGEVTHISISGKPIFDTDGKFLGYRGSGQDISALVRADETIRNERDRAEQAVRAKSEFLASMSHELRTPLNAILGFSEMLKLNIYGPLSHPKYQEFAEDIHLTGRHLLAVIGDLLDLSKIEAGKQPVIAAETDVSEIIKKCIEIVRLDADAKNIHITLTAKSFLPTIHVDSRQLLQIFLNLVNNAIKYTDVGGRIEVSAEHEAPESLLIQIKDTGVGIAPSDISRMSYSPEFGH